MAKAIIIDRAIKGFVFAGLFSIYSIQAADILNNDGVVSEAHYQKGLTALVNGSYDLAIIHLEQALLLNPQHVGAQIDLAVAYCEAKQEQSCEVALKQLSQRYDYAFINQLVNRYSPVQWQHQTQVDLGHSNNLNHGLSISELNININGLPAQLVLSRDSRATEGVFTDVAHITRWQSSRLTQRKEVWASFYTRLLDQQQPQVTFAQSGGLQRYALGTSKNSIAVGGQLAYLGFEQSYRFQSVALLSELHLAEWLWKPKLSLAQEYRQQLQPQDQVTLSSISFGIVPTEYWQIKIQSEWDKAEQREWGDTQRWLMQVSGYYPINETLRVQWMAQSMLSQDERAYAPLIFTQARQYQQNVWQIGWISQLDRNWSWQCYLRNADQRANYAIFDWQEQSISCGVSVVQ